MAITGLITKYAAAAVGLILFGLFARRAYQVGIGPAAGEIGSSFGAFGTGIGSLGTGIKELGQGIGTGAAKLFDPLFTLRDLIFPPEAGNQPAPTAATQGQTPPQTPPSTSPVPPQTPIPQPQVTITPGQQLTTQQVRNLLTTQQVTAKRGALGVLTRLEQGSSTVLRGENLQLYANKRAQIVAVRPSTAIKLRQRGYF
jgi:hypothetical protein